MSHVSALPGPAGGIASGLDDTVEAAQYALSTLTNLNNGDAIDAAVGVLSVAAVLRVIYGLIGTPDIGIHWLLQWMRGGRANSSCD